MWKGRRRASSSLWCCSLYLNRLPSTPHPWNHSHRDHILSKHPWNGEHRNHLSHGKRKAAILPARGSFPRCSQISSYSRLVTSQGVGALVAWEFFRACGQTSVCFCRVTHKQPGMCMSAPGQTSDCESTSFACHPPQSLPYRLLPWQYFSTTSCVHQEVKHIWVRPTTRSQLTQEFVHIWSLCFT